MTFSRWWSKRLDSSGSESNKIGKRDLDTFHCWIEESRNAGLSRALAGHPLALLEKNTSNDFQYT